MLLSSQFCYFNISDQACKNTPIKKANRALNWTEEQESCKDTDSNVDADGEHCQKKYGQMSFYGTLDVLCNR